MLMEAMGFEALACYDGHSALDSNDKFRPSLCFIDLNMPGMDGDVLTTHLLSNAGWCPMLVVALTAMSDEKSRDRVSAAGFHMHLIKPVDPQKLIDVVDRLFMKAEYASGSATCPEVSDDRQDSRP
jgi:CheY-like chemotaxis protein